MDSRERAEKKKGWAQFLTAYQPFQIGIEARIGDGNTVRVLKLGGTLGGESSNGKGHGDPVVHMGRDCGAV